MRKIVLMMSMSLDGYIEGPDREIDWHLVDDELHQHFNDVLKEMGAFLNGRVTYELMAGFWPTADADPHRSGPMIEYARIWRNMPKVVFSRTLEHADWHTTVVRDVVVDDILALKAQDGGDLALGGAALAAEFLRLDLVDEFRVYVHPILVGRGQRLFPDSDALTALRLIDSRRFGNGVVLLHYERPGAADR
ncbi:dihydrofolate reductase family protein [Streptomyces sp. NPDC003631]|uniref:dihydrofolate reductase family protein n=1 Tax=unclassified Streptomyces TaxID=2593676 RepID=UPI000741328B|nr:MULTISPECIES: dihydrofolate reductase family protein [unclassified Streptomyces]MEE1666640.1 dihydrofolate reductase family protein [Streptomyces sp. WAC07094]TFV32885.1 dihydrofolate reductase [Streptomyces sp. T1317-0309]KUJ39749.1 deaminase [Streptomyces sp. NRRL F-5122]MBW8701179.1 Dihydrofolate reductase [Streptomyces sp. MBT84]MDX3260260.1 dihydrofolate reductase family protein [Streptomyces sp. MI02-2A]